MATYAIMHDGIVTNVIVAEVTEPLHMFFPDAEIVLADESSGVPHMVGDLKDGRFRPPQPFQSWVWKDSSWGWEAPVPYPDEEVPYVWDENEVAWVEVLIEVPIDPEIAPTE